MDPVVPRVRFVIQAHPSRSHLVDALREKIPLAGVCWDVQGPWIGYQRCLSGTPPRVTHVCVIQDDATPCRNFVPRVLEAVSEKPDDLISLFVGGIKNLNYTRFIEALRSGEKWSLLTSRNSIDILHVVGMVWPLPLAQEFLAWASTTRCANPNSDDAYVTKWAKETRCEVWATVPSLVEHEDRVPSTIGRSPQEGRNKKRVAIAFADSS